MKAILFLIVAVAFFAVVLSDPSPPKWPVEFSASIFGWRNDGHRRHFRWFYDYTDGLERFDGMVEWKGEHYFAEIIKNYASQTKYHIYYQEGEVTCLTTPINGSMHYPDLSSFQFAGLSIVGYDTCNHWMLNDQPDQFFFQLWDRTSDRALKRIDVVNEEDRHEETWEFMEMDITSQDSELFVISPLILSICTPMH